jgi:hypothetical protein
MRTLLSSIAGGRRKLQNRLDLVLYGGGVVTSMLVWAGTSPTAKILQNATAGHRCDSGDSSCTGGSDPNSTFDLFNFVNNLLGPALWIIVGLAPLAMAWGAGAMLFGGRHGPQIMGGAIVAVVLVASARGIAA